MTGNTPFKHAPHAWREPYPLFRFSLNLELTKMWSLNYGTARKMSDESHPTSHLYDPSNLGALPHATRFVGRAIDDLFNSAPYSNFDCKNGDFDLSEKVPIG